ncbi:uncharacterized protein LOC112558246 [Pomacea canaliculata]|uniref:uncharacterized protein LOC112558246 n=1 Tax=Pomacea canaliculata TaxID=400727 RepID=UPI000D730583|nr:uncharacterized protein LOC112558246 [Pomacea canaliculata]
MSKFVWFVFGVLTTVVYLTLGQTQVCQAPFGHFPSNLNDGCTTFYWCWNGRAHLRQCPPGLSFDVNTLGCVSQQQVACVNNNQAAAPQGINVNPGSPDRPNSRPSTRYKCRHPIRSCAQQSGSCSPSIQTVSLLTLHQPMSHSFHSTLDSPFPVLVLMLGSCRWITGAGTAVGLEELQVQKLVLLDGRCRCTRTGRHW